MRNDNSNNNMNNRALLIDTARKMFEKDGYEATSISAIRTAAGLSNGTFYHYFKNKEELLSAICEQNTAMIYDLTQDIEDKLKDPTKHISAYFMSYAQYWMRLGVEITWQVYKDYDRIFDGGDPSKNPEYRINDLMQFIRAAQEKGRFSTSMTAEEYTRYLFILSRGILFEWMLHHNDSDLLELSQKYLDMIYSPLKK